MQRQYQLTILLAYSYQLCVLSIAMIIVSKFVLNIIDIFTDNYTSGEFSFSKGVEGCHFDFIRIMLVNVMDHVTVLLWVSNIMFRIRCLVTGCLSYCNDVSVNWWVRHVIWYLRLKETQQSAN